MSKTVLFLCTGNTCRSPMAEGFARMIFQEKGLPYRVESAGLFADGGPANEKSVMAAKALYNVDISAHRSQQLTAEIAENASRIYTMTPEQATALSECLPSIKHKVSPITPDGIDDPYGGSEETYRQCAEMIFNAVRTIAEELEHVSEES